MTLTDRARPSRLGERFDIILDAAIGYNNAMRGREITLSQACELCAFLSTQLLIVEAELVDEKRGRMADREQAKLLILSYKKTLAEAEENAKRFGWSQGLFSQQEKKE